MSQPLVSIVIPVKNGMPFLKEVLKAIFEQDTTFPFEVVIVDSGSRDGFLEHAKTLDLTLLTIPSSEFNHGSTRNYAMSKARGDFFVMLTHDAKPMGRKWLQNLVQPMLDDSSIAGVYGRHVARPDEDPIVEYGLEDHFNRMGSRHPAVWQQDDGYDSNRGEYVFFSNNNSCLRRSVWEKIPFRHTDMAEDQQWAEDIIKAGYKKAYADSSLVMHSHSFKAKEWLHRSFDEYRSYLGLGLVQQRGLKATVKNALWLWRQDLRVLKKLPKPFSFKISWAFRRFWICWAIAFGQYFGTNFEKMPKGALGFFSMQDRNKRATS